jgi:glycosyltransferase involved in cell wall biosynthesis
MFGEDWGAHPSTTQHLARHLAENHKIAWVNSIGLRRPRLDRHDLTRLGQKLASALHGAPKEAGREPPPPNMTVLTPVILPFPGNRLVERVNREFLAAQLRPALTRLAIDAPILWTSLPSAVCALGALGERAVVYYCGDDFGALVGVDNAAAIEMERRLVARADVIFAAHQALVARFPPERTIYLPHGVDIDHFGSPTARASDMPTGRPIAGFYGSISDWIDVEMMAKAARDLPDWLFVLIGGVHTDIAALQGLENVRFLGPRPHSQLPAYIQHWTVALIPFRDTPQIRASDPLKLREYLASGTPIAAASFPALAPFKELISIAYDRARFAETIRSAAADKDKKSLRQAAVADQTWHARVRTVEEVLEKL